MRLRSNKTRLLSMLAACAMLLGVMSPISAQGASHRGNAVYTGRAIVSNYDYGLTVNVTMSGSSISSITAEHDTNGYDTSNDMFWNWAVNGRTVGGVFKASPLKQIVEKQSTTNIDTVSGATYTCNALIQAVEKALAQVPTTTTDGGVYALVNIPYEDFYGAENAGNFDVDAVSSATGKAGNYNLTGGSFHSAVTAGYDENGELISVGAQNGAHVEGVTWPVRFENEAALEALVSKGGIVVTDERSVIVASASHGKVSSTELVGSASLMEAPAYSYYLLSDAPANYMQASVENGSPVFSANSGSVQSFGLIDPSVAYSTRWGDVEIDLGCAEETSGKQINAMVFTAEDGTTAGMIHLYNIWVGNKIGWHAKNVPGLDNKKLTGVRFYCNDKQGNYFVYDYSLDEDIKEVYQGDTTAEFVNPLEIAVGGYPEDAQNLTAIAYYSVGKQRYYITATETGADGKVVPVQVPVIDGKIELSTLLTEEKIVSVEFTSDNYAIKKATCEYTPVEFIMGDVDESGSVTTADAVLAMRAAIGVADLNAFQTFLADVNADGAVTVTDVIVILKTALNLA